MAYTKSNLVNPMNVFDYTLMLKITITGESMTGPDHYRAAERFLEEGKVRRRLQLSGGRGA